MSRSDEDAFAAASAPNAVNGHAGDDEQDKGPPQRIKVLLAAKPFLALWRDQDHGAYATIDAGAGHLEHYPIRSSAFRRWLIRRYGATYPTFVNGSEVQTAPSSQSLAEALAALEAEAMAGDEFAPAVRVGGTAEAVYLDLGGPDWSAVEITADGWRLVASSPVKFIRPNGLRALPTPLAGGDVDELRDVLNLPAGEAGDQAFKLLVGVLLAMLRPRGPYPVLCVAGEQGSGKSTLMTVVKRLVDPSRAERRAPPSDEKDLLIAARHGHVLSLDNLSKVDEWLADALARLSTGGAFGTRALYSDDEENILVAVKPVVVNGIPDLTTRADLADRAVLIKLAAMSDAARRTEDELAAELEAATPRILGALLDGVACALADLAEVKELMAERAERPRMIDFACWVEAAARAFGWRRWDWLGVYTGNRDEAAEVALDADPIAEALRRLLGPRRQDHEGIEAGPLGQAMRALQQELDAGDCNLIGYGMPDAQYRAADPVHSRTSPPRFQGTATHLLRALDAIVSEAVRKQRSWPKDPTRLSGRLRRLAPGLRRMGIEVADMREGKDRRRLLVIEQRVQR